MATAVFESEPQASAAAVVLRELGFEARVMVPGDNNFDERTRDFFTGKPAPFEPHAVLTSSDADSERFAHTVQRHYGIIVADAA